jgi:arsenate reductase
LEVVSAGIVESYVHPKAIMVMKEIGIDISNHRSKNMMEFVDQSFDYVISACEESDSLCPAWIGAGKKFHIGFPDPVSVKGTEEEILNAFRSVRDDMKEKLISFLQSKV